ncbi:histidine kinase dimerization/phosphoacceptor domain -containing protein [Belliella kenyensis]|uniref:Histidine kinase dimerization/phosphoacceptor domain -containing protein n=1 Tax=Belliella kenyensis TaxID=1472724 RepID=A0ABV8EPB1_9BACT|nr:histidine kinase dimerization/phosphoacceptor domain -containing protein [Belliella kenyensis]MCH7402790.1 tetratricopeptide repeat protein [Belliella kenyensis]MDN3602495.1 tetratricopeptide repeat protein [Belliella kenyensis]
MKNIIFRLLLVYFSLFQIDFVEARQSNIVSTNEMYQIVSELQSDHKHEEAIRILLKLVDNKLWIKDEENARKTHNKLGYSYYMLHQYEKSSFHYQRATELAKKLQNTEKLIDSFTSLGMALRRGGMYTKSVEVNQEALELAIFLKDTVSICNILNTLGILYQDIEDWSKAINNHHRALVLSETTSDTLMSSFLHTNLAISYRSILMIDSSLIHNKLSLSLKESMGQEELEKVKIYNNIGLDYLELDSLELALSFLERSNQIYHMIEDKKGLVSNYNNLAKLALKESEPTKALTFLNKAELLLNDFSMPIILQDLIKTKIEALEALGEFGKALEAQKHLLSIKEDIFQKEKIGIQKLETAYLLREKELESQSFAQEAELAKLKARKNTQIVLVLLLALVFAVFIIFLVSKLNKRLKLSNEIIQAQKLDLKHFTYNTLMRIQGLLRLTSNSVSDQLIRESLYQAEAAVVSAASLQKFTYSIENIDHVMLGNYLSELMDHLNSTFRITNTKKVRFKVEIINDFTLPVFMVLNIGLITAEIVTNSLKYAFEDSMDNPEITLTLFGTVGNLNLKIKDNGKGLDKDWRQNGVGHGLITKLARHIKAELTSYTDNGTTFILYLKLKNGFSI